MTPPEYIQLKAYARIDGAMLSLLWVCGFVFNIIGFSSQTASMVALGLFFSTPFFVAIRLRIFRDEVREGIISFLRSWAYVAFVFFYGSILFALAVFIYFSFLDQGYVIHMVQTIMQMPEVMAAVKEANMEGAVSQMLTDLQQVRPIDIAINMMTTNILLGIVLGLPIAAIMRSGQKKTDRR